MTRRVLFLTFYYPPELTPGAFRAKVLVSKLEEKTATNMSIDVITCQPHRYDSYSELAEEYEDSDKIKINRIAISKHKSGVFGQFSSFLSFAYGVLKLTRNKQYDLVLVTSSRLMTAVLGAWIASRKKARLYLDIRDLFVSNIKELFSFPLNKIFGTVFGFLEKWAINRADKVNLVSPGFIDYFKKRYPNKKFSLYSNGIDSEFINFPVENNTEVDKKEIIQVLYAGNIGDGQGLDYIIPELALKLSERIKFRIIGTGGRLNVLKEKVLEKNIGNIEFIDPMPRLELLDEYKKADVLFLHLNNFDSFLYVLPSKVFEYAATGKPIWAGVAGYSEKFITDEIDNATVFAPCDVDKAIYAFERLEIKSSPRTEFIANNNREKIIDAMIEDILQS